MLPYRVGCPGVQETPKLKVPKCFICSLVGYSGDLKIHILIQTDLNFIPVCITAVNEAEDQASEE